MFGNEFVYLMVFMGIKDCCCIINYISIIIKDIEVIKILYFWMYVCIIFYFKKNYYLDFVVLILE